MGGAASFTMVVEELAELLDEHLTITAEVLADLGAQGVDAVLLAAIGADLADLGEQVQRDLAPLTTAAGARPVRAGLRLWPPEPQ
ncbi:hypothetical protein [Actinoplanes sp. NPDC049316]|uniref:hypothetical protein n=1 Tax=Actinoplanes sp. NPDC049316 TaxID=3154727 RepID=UPI00343380FC